jgi:hypothetical protein
MMDEGRKVEGLHIGPSAERRMYESADAFVAESTIYFSIVEMIISSFMMPWAPDYERDVPWCFREEAVEQLMKN